MRAHPFAVWLVFVVIGDLIALPSFCNNATVQAKLIHPAQASSGREQNRDKRKKPKAPDIVDDKPVSPPKGKGRTTRRAQKVVEPLQLDWKVLRPGKDNLPQAVDPSALFRDGDRYQLQIIPKEEGYLYIIQQSYGKDGRPSPDGGKLVFPNLRMNGGESFVNKDENYTIPFEAAEDGRWMKMGSSAKREVFIVILSRNRVMELHYDIKAGLVKRKDIEDIKNRSGKTYSWMIRPAFNLEEGDTSVYVTSVKNFYPDNVKNRTPKDEKELITTIEIINESPPPPERKKPELPPPPKEPEPPPNLNHKVFKLGKDDKPEEVKADTIFKKNDGFRLQIKPNKDVQILYVIQEYGKKSDVAFSHLRTNSDQIVKNGQEHNMTCNEPENNCRFKVKSSTGPERITVIFSARMMSPPKNGVGPGSEVKQEAVETILLRK